MFARQVELSPDVRLVAQAAAALVALLKTCILLRDTAVAPPVNFMPLPLAFVIVPPWQSEAPVCAGSQRPLPPAPVTVNEQAAFTTTGVAAPLALMLLKVNAPVAVVMPT